MFICHLSFESSSFYLCHSHLGHVSSTCLKFLASTGALRQLQTHDIPDCSGCKLEKFQFYLLIEVFLFLLLPMTRFIMMYGGVLLFPQKKGFDIMFLLLMIILAIVGFILSHPDSRSDPNGGSELGSRREIIYWDSLSVFFFFQS